MLVYRLSRQLKMLEVVPSLTRRERSTKIVITHEAHISTQILTYYLLDIICYIY